MPNGQEYYDVLPISQGGFVRGGMAADDGTWAGRADTYNAPIKYPDEDRVEMMLRIGITVAFDQLTPKSDKDASGVATGAAGSAIGGAGDVAICETNSAHTAIIANGRVLTSTQRHGPYTKKTGFDYVHIGANFDEAAYHRRMAYDPINTNILAVGDPALGLRYTLNLNSGATVVTHPDIPAPIGAKPVIGIVFDRSSSQTGGYTHRIIVYSSGNGFYEGLDGLGGSFSHIAGSPTQSGVLKVHPDNGAVWATNVSTDVGQLMRYLGGVWFSPPSANQIKSVTCVPGSGGNRVYANQWYGGMQCSFNAATTCSFTPPVSQEFQSRVAPRSPWLAWTQELFMSNGDICWDPAEGRVIFFEGVGVWAWEDPITSGTLSSLIWTNIGLEFEQLVSMHILVTPDGAISVSSQDRAWFLRERHENKQYPKTHGPNRLQSLMHAKNSDYAIDDYHHIVQAQSGPWRMAYTNDRKSFIQMPKLPLSLQPAPAGEDLGSGQIAVGLKGRALYQSVNRRAVYYNNDYTNPAVEWAIPDFGAAANAYMIPNAEVQGMDTSYTQARISIIVDKVTGHCYFYWLSRYEAGAERTACQGIWRSEVANDYSKLIRVYTGLLGEWGYDFYNGKFVQPHNKAGHFFWTGGNVGGIEHAGNPMYFTKDGWATHVALGGSAPTEVQALGFGFNPDPGATYPIIRVFSEDFGFYECRNFNPDSPNAATWTFLYRFPGGDQEFMTCIAGDPGLYGRWYYGNGGAGYRQTTFENRILCG